MSNIVQFLTTYQSFYSLVPVQVQMKKTEADFQEMIQERMKKVEEIKSCLKLSTVSLVGLFLSCFLLAAEGNIKRSCKIPAYSLG